MAHMRNVTIFLLYVVASVLAQSSYNEGNEEDTGFCYDDSDVSCEGLPTATCNDIDGCRTSLLDGDCYGYPRTPCESIDVKTTCEATFGCKWSDFDLADVDFAGFFAPDKSLEDVYVSIEVLEGLKVCRRGCRITMWVFAGLIAISFAYVAYGICLHLQFRHLFTNFSVLTSFGACTYEVMFGIVSIAYVVDHWDDGTLTPGNKLWLICTGSATVAGGFVEGQVWGLAANRNRESWPVDFLEDALMGYQVYGAVSVQVVFGFYPAIASLATMTLRYGWVLWIVYVVSICIVYEFISQCKQEHQASDELKRRVVFRSRAVEFVFISAPLLLFEVLAVRGVSILGAIMAGRELMDFVRNLRKGWCGDSREKGTELPN